MAAALEASTLEVSTRASGRSGQADLFAGLSDALHEMSQPMTVLLCVLEYAAGLDSAAEMKEVLGAGVEACARLSATVRAMQIEVRQAAVRDGGG